MSNGESILIVSPESQGDMLADHLSAGGNGTRAADGYEALELMGQKAFSGVLVGSVDGEVPGFCRAARRLQRQAKIVALCTPAQEPDVRPLRGAVIDDYFIHPPSRADLSSIRRIFGTNGRVEQTGSQPAEPTGPDARLVAQLLDAARSESSLESRLARMAAEELGVEARWVAAEDLPPEAQTLLTVSGDAPKMLIPAGQAEQIHADGRVLLEYVQQLLPALYQNAWRTESLHRLAITDHLTGAYNRRYFYHLTDQILLRARQKNIRVTLLLYDIDNFKRYNDAYGYSAGDEILRETTRLMRSVCRQHDIVARIGGDEFAVLFWDPDRPRSPDSQPLDDIHKLAERFRWAVTKHKYPELGPDAEGALSISGGLARFPDDGQSCRSLLRSADRAIKQAKRAGKNSVVLIGTPEEPPI
ncbi:MAG: diguanylate cyclase [Phycisphaerae bacterium]